MAEVAGTWEIAFFDRTPDSLFGDDVKTRNCIVLLTQRRHAPKALHTSTFVRWNSRQRSTLFSDLRFCPVEWTLARDFLPKLGSHAEVEYYRTVRREKHEDLRTYALIS